MLSASLNKTFPSFHEAHLERIRKDSSRDQHDPPGESEREKQGERDISRNTQGGGGGGGGGERETSHINNPISGSNSFVRLTGHSLRLLVSSVFAPWVDLRAIKQMC